MAPGFASAALFAPVVAEFADHELAHRVIEIGGIERAARGLLAGIGGILESDFTEHFLRILDRHPAGVETDGGHESDVAEEGI